MPERSWAQCSRGVYWTLVQCSRVLVPSWGTTVNALISGQPVHADRSDRSLRSWRAREGRGRRVGRVTLVELDIAAGDGAVAIVGSSLIKLGPTAAESDGKSVDAPARLAVVGHL